MKTKDIGNLGEVKVLCKLIELGYNVSIPYGDNTPYDLIIEKDCKLYKIQIKASTQTSEGKTTFELSGRRRNSTGQKTSTYTNQDVDYYALYSIVRDKIYLVSFKDASSNSINIRFENPKNNNFTNVKMENDYLIEKVLETI